MVDQHLRAVAPRGGPHELSRAGAEAFGDQPRKVAVAPGQGVDDPHRVGGPEETVTGSGVLAGQAQGLDHHVRRLGQHRKVVFGLRVAQALAGADDHGRSGVDSGGHGLDTNHGRSRSA